MFRTHIAFAVFVYFLIIKLFSLDFAFIPFILIIFGSILPDMDHPKSFINRHYLIGIGKIVSLFSEHRGFWHSLLGLLTISIISYALVLLTPLNHLINHNLVLFLVFGYFLHLLLDSFTPSGIKWLWKNKKLRTKGFIKTNSLSENILFIFLIIISTLLILGTEKIKYIFGLISKIA